MLATETKQAEGKSLKIPMLTFEAKTHGAWLLQRYAALQRSGTFCDLVIRVGHKDYECHKLVLAACSDFFLSQFTQAECKNPLHLRDIDLTAFDYIFNFMYSAKLDVPRPHVSQLYKLSKLLKVRQVEKACINFLMENVTIENALDIRASCHQDRQEDAPLCEVVDSFLRENASAVLSDNALISYSVITLHAKIALESSELMPGLQEDYLASLLMEYIECLVDYRESRLESLSNQTLELFLTKGKKLVNFAVVHDSKRSVEHTNKKDNNDLDKSQNHAKNTFKLMSGKSFDSPGTHSITSQSSIVSSSAEDSELLVVVKGEHVVRSLMKIYGRLLLVSIKLCGIGHPDEQESVANYRFIGSSQQISCSSSICSSSGHVNLQNEGDTLTSMSNSTNNTLLWLQACCNHDSEVTIVSDTVRHRIRNHHPPPPIDDSSSQHSSCHSKHRSDASDIMDGQPAYLAEMHVPRSAARAVALLGNADNAHYGDRVFVMGGYNRTDSCLAHCELYDSCTNSWSIAPPLPIPRSRFAAHYDVHSGLVFALGGSGPHANLSRVDCFRESTEEWSPTGTCRDMPDARCSHVAVVQPHAVQTQLCVLGGCSGPNSLADCLIYDWSRDEWLPMPSMLQARSQSAACAYAGAIYVVGGVHDSLLGCLSTGEWWDPRQSHGWQPIANPLPQERRGAELLYLATGAKALQLEGEETSSRDCLVLVGGCDQQGARKLSFIFEPRMQKWLSGPVLNIPRVNIAACVSQRGDAIYAIGGFSGKHFLHHMEYYSPPLMDEWSLNCPLAISSSQVHHNGHSGSVSLEISSPDTNGAKAAC